MSFSGQVKDELYEVIGSGRHCKLAELAALFTMADADMESKAGKKLEKLSGMLNINPYEDEAKKALKIVKDTSGYTIDRLLIEKSCCKQAYIRGAFLASGSVTNPERGYHLEIVCNSIKKAEMLVDIIKDFGIESKIVMRKKSYVCYIKDGSMIVDLLNVMGAHASLMDMENVRILKDVRNTVNRKVNCETANLNKTVSAAVKQIEDIRYIEEKKGLKYLPDNLRSLAILRLSEPEMSLNDLGENLSPPLGKSGVNHRLRKISEIANELRRNN
ncbi:MAG: DNA-binding protein WhiA [Lachnospiraceae bacterium]|nr:DNA-binding protein WhiA [Lachnospiraceae bacterium]